jgi:hypothetical protein
VNEVFIEVEEERNNFLWNFIKKMKSGCDYCEDADLKRTESIKKFILYDIVFESRVTASKER